MNTNDTYTISTGRTNGYFTIRHQYDDREHFRTEGGGSDSRIVRRDNYVCSLGNHIETAKANLAKWEAESGKKVLNPQFIDAGLRDITRGGGDTFPAGKHAGKTPAQVAEIDRPYLLWACRAFSGKKHVTLNRAIFDIVGDEVSALEVAKAAAEHDICESAIETAEQNSWLIDFLTTQTWSSFCCGVAQDIGANWLAVSRLDQEAYKAALTKQAEDIRRGTGGSSLAPYASPQIAEVVNRYGTPYDFDTDGKLCKNHIVPRAISSLSPRCLDIIRDIYGKNADGRRKSGSKAYEANVAKFDELLSACKPA